MTPNLHAFLIPELFYSDPKMSFLKEALKDCLQREAENILSRLQTSEDPSDKYLDPTGHLEFITIKKRAIPERPICRQNVEYRFFERRKQPNFSNFVIAVLLGIGLAAMFTK